jgi:hypothetical protein
LTGVERLAVDLLDKGAYHREYANTAVINFGNVIQRGTPENRLRYGHGSRAKRREGLLFTRVDPWKRNRPR